MRPLQLLGPVFLALLAAGLALATDGEATHIRGGSLSNVPDPATLEVTFDGWWAERLDWSGHAVGDVVLGPSLYFGDGKGTVTWLQVTAVSVDENWWKGRLQKGPVDEAPIVHTYPAQLNGGRPWEAHLSDCCRLASSSNGGQDGHLNNPHTPVRILTTIDLQGGIPSPVVSLPPVIMCPYEATCRRDITFAAPSADVSYRSPQPEEAVEPRPGQSSEFVRPGPPHAPGLAQITPGHELVWDTVGAAQPASAWNYYSLHFIAVAADGLGLPADAETAVEVMIRIPRRPLYWAEPASCKGIGTPSSDPGATQAAYPTQAFEWTAVAFTTLEGDQVSRIEVLEGPHGLEATGGGPGPSSTLRLRWVPTEAELGLHAIRIRAYNATEGQSVDCLLLADVKEVYLRLSFGVSPGGGQHTFRPWAGWPDDPGVGLDLWWRYSGTLGHEDRPTSIPPGDLRMQLPVGAHRICLMGSWYIEDAQATPPYEGTQQYCRTVVVRAPPADSDGDGFADPQDDCPGVHGRSRGSPDGTGACRSTASAGEPRPPEATSTPRAEAADVDRDGIPDDADNCVRVPNRDQADLDDDGDGDVCDDDVDGDRIAESGDGPLDNCPRTPNPGQQDADGNGRGDVCDLAGPKAVAVASDGTPRQEAADARTVPQRSAADPALATAGAQPVLVASALLMAAAGILLITILMAQPRRRRPSRAVALTR